MDENITAVVGDRRWVGHTSHFEDLHEIATLINNHGSERLKHFVENVLDRGSMIIVLRSPDN